jgi:SAM-dependent methyltransferase
LSLLEEVEMGSAALQGQLWGAAAQDWAHLQEPFSLPIWTALLDATHIRPGTRLLDAGCGAGGACVGAARRGAQVSGLDAAEALLGIARARVPDGGFHLGDLEAHPYPDHAFDAVIAADAISYAANPLAAIGELRRVCAPRGRIAVAVWGCPGQCEVRVVFQAVAEALPTPLPGGWPFAHSAPSAVARLVGDAGLRQIEVGEVLCPCFYSDPHAAWRALRTTGPLQAALRVGGEALVRGVVLRAVARYQSDDTGVRIRQWFHYVVAAPPGGRGPW